MQYAPNLTHLYCHSNSMLHGPCMRKPRLLGVLSGTTG